MFHANVNLAQQQTHKKMKTRLNHFILIEAGGGDCQKQVKWQTLGIFKKILKILNTLNTFKY